MSTRDDLNKLNVNILKSLALEKGLEIKKKKKEDLVKDLLLEQAPVLALTPVVPVKTELEAIAPSFKENLPPFNRVSYVDIIEWPEITFSSIYNYMIRRERSTGAGEGVNNFKGLDRAVKHYSAGDVKIRGFAQINNAVTYVKASCQASMKKINYNVYLCFSKSEDGESQVDYGYCQCPVGLAQTCSHIGSLLFALKNGKIDKKDNISCTSKLCEWNVPRQNVKPTPMRTLSIRKPSINLEKADKEELSNFDPRHTDDREPNVDSTLHHLRSLRQIFPNTGMAHLWNIPSDDVPEAFTEMEIETTQDPMYLEMEKMIITKGNLPSVSISEDLVNYIEKFTRRQRQSEMWKKLHFGRITSSIFGDVLKAGDNPNSLVRQIMEGSNLDRYSSPPPAVQWGITSERKAREDYIKFKGNFVTELNIEETGLTLCSIHSFLGASSDGRVIEDGDKGLLEIKCPYSIKGQKVNEMEVLHILSIKDKDFCLINQDGVRLNKNHKYYAQVQGEMAMMSLPWCDFVVWTAAKTNNIFVDRIYFDVEFVSSMLPKLVEFYINHIYPLLNTE